MFRNPTVDVLLVLLIVLLIFGPKRIPSVMGSLGRGMREFKDGITGGSKGEEGADHPEIARTTAQRDGVTSAAEPDAAAPQPEPQSAQSSSEQRS